MFRQVDPDYMIALCEHQSAYQAYIAVVSRFKQLYKDVSEKAGTILQVWQRRIARNNGLSARKKKRKKKTQQLNQAVAVLEQVDYKIYFLEKHLVCAKPFETMLKKNNGGGDWLEEEEHAKYIKLCGPLYEAKCEGFRRVLAERDHASINEVEGDGDEEEG